MEGEERTPTVLLLTEYSQGTHGVLRMQSGACLTVSPCLDAPEGEWRPCGSEPDEANKRTDNANRREEILRTSPMGNANMMAES